MSDSDSEPQEKEVRARQWTATLWLHQAHTCLEETMKNLTDTGRVRFIAYGEEVCPSTGHLHYQAYVVFYNPVRMASLIKYFGSGHHFEVMRGSLQQNQEYCMKEGSFHKLGDEPRQGERHDLIGFKRKLDEGLQPEVVAEEEGHFASYVKYHKGFEKYAHHMRSKTVRVDREPPKVYIRIGDSGTGKTRWLDDTFGADGWARMPNPTSSWWITPTVSNASTVLIDDVGSGKVPKIEEFLEWTDRYPLEFNAKGGFLWWKPKNIVFTSNQPILEWWPKIETRHYDAVMRRIFRIDWVYKQSEMNRVEYPNQDGEEEGRKQRRLREQEVQGTDGSAEEGLSMEEEMDERQERICSSCEESDHADGGEEVQGYVTEPSVEV